MVRRGKFGYIILCHQIMSGGYNMNKISRIEHFPVSFFSVIMGLAGFTLVLQKVEVSAGVGHTASTIVLSIVIGLFALIAFLYIVKLIRFPQAVIEEKNNPVRLSFFPTFTISLLLISVGLLDHYSAISLYFWVAGAVLHLVATLYILSSWIWQENFEIHHFNPAWFIPIVGNIIVPIAGVAHAPAEISWFFFSIGIVFWIIFFTIFIYRVIFHRPIAEKLLPTFFILIAPPSLAFISFTKLTGEITHFSMIMYYFALFLVFFLLVQAKVFFRIRFYLSWWAYSFPVASVNVATYMMGSLSQSPVLMAVFYFLAGLLTLFIGVLLFFTLREIGREGICIPE